MAVLGAWGGHEEERRRTQTGSRFKISARRSESIGLSCLVTASHVGIYGKAEYQVSRCADVLRIEDVEGTKAMQCQKATLLRSH
jgi:hypothetical protein